MSTPLPLAGELADDLLMAPMRSAHICSGERMPSARGAACITWFLSRSAKPGTDFPAQSGDLSYPHAAAPDRRA